MHRTPFLRSPILRSSALVILAAMTACSSDSSSSDRASSTQNAAQSTTQSDSTASAHPAAATAPATPSGFKIGAFLRGTAPDAAAAKAFEQGMELAAEASPPPSPKLAVFERSEGGVGSDSLKSLTSGGNVPVIVYWQTSDLAPVAPTLSSSEVVSIPVWNVTKTVARLGTNVFGFGYSTERSFAEFAKFAGKNLKSYRFGIISSSAEPFDTQSKAFIEETKSLGNTVVFDEKADAGADFAALVKRAAKESCDTIFATLPADSLVALIKAARAAAYKGKILVGDSFYASELATLGKDAEGIYVLQAWSDDPAFEKQFVAKFGGQPDGITLGAAALGFDLVKCIDIAGPTPDAEAIKYSWLSSPCNGLTGKTMFSGERIAQRQKRILTVKDGKLQAAS